MLPAHLPDQTYLSTALNASGKIRILLSGCLSGRLCGWDGSSYGEYPVVQQLIAHSKIETVSFCPEDYSFGTPRALCNIHGGDGYDVLDGKAKVLTETGEDWTAGMIAAARKMLELAKTRQVHLALLMDISAACGSQVIYDGNRTGGNVVYQKGPGVCAALLIRNGIKVLSQRDHRTLETIYTVLDAGHIMNGAAIDHHETEWYRSYFK